MTRAKPQSLPAFVEPMLASESAPFDGDDWLFEIKWDGFRALARRDRDACRLLGRRKTDFSSRFPTLTRALSALPPGSIIDGEIVAMIDGKPDFSTLLRRTPNKRGTIVYVAFDLLYERGSSVMGLACEERRGRLRRLLNRSNRPGDAKASASVVPSEAIVGDGQACFREAVAMGLEGVMAKRRQSTYRPGVRTGDWLKIKHRQEMVCAVIGYEPSDDYGLKSLIIAAPTDDELVCVGRVGSGMDEPMRARLFRELRLHERKTPVIACRIKGHWVEPRWFCRVSYAQQLESGHLRAPVFEGLIQQPRA